MNGTSRASSRDATTLHRWQSREHIRGGETMSEGKTLHDAFLDELRDSYDAEKQLTKALPKLAKAASNPKLRGRLSPTSRRPKATSSVSNRCSRASMKGFAGSTVTASPASSKKASRSWKKT